MQNKATKTQVSKVDITLAGAIQWANGVVAESLTRYPRMPAAELTDRLMRPSKGNSRLSEELLRGFYMHAVTSSRRKESVATSRNQPMLPGFEHLPRKIGVGDGKRIRLLSANLAAVRLYYESLISAPQIVETKSLLDEMTKAGREDITVREALRIEA